jgi:8-amino-7-oxononanoate synthase
MPSDFAQKFSDDLQNGLRALEERDQLRSLTELSGVDLCSNDYLGLAQHPKLRESLIRAVTNATRVGGTASRLLSGQDVAWHDLEEEFASFVGTEASLYFGSGYAANLGLLTTLAGPDDVIFSDALNHASLIDGIRLSGARKHIYAHRDLNMLESLLIQYRDDWGRKLIVTETVFSMDGNLAPIREMVSLAERYDAGIILDEAHATAVHGPDGRGVAADFADSQNIVARVHTCGKALASAGAFVCGGRSLKEYLVNHARSFIFTTAMPPYMAAQIRAALALACTMNAERAALQRNAERLGAALRAQAWDTAASATQIIPVIVGQNEAALSAAEFLRREGFAVRAIRPPTVAAGTARLRFSLTAAIGEKDLVRLGESLQRWRELQHAPVTAGAATANS